MTITIAISNQKGGVAKTTSCATLGACLAEAGLRTLIVDLDPQAHLTMVSGLDPEELTWTIVDVLNASSLPPDASAAIQHTSVPGLDILPTDQRLVELEFGLKELGGYEMLLKKLLEPLKMQYDLILMDCPPSIGVITLMALTAADLALIPVQCDYFAVRGLMRLLEIVDFVKQRTNPALEYALFVSMFDSRPLISRRVLDQLRINFPDHLLQTVIGIDTRIREALMANEPVITYAAKTRASEQYRRLAKELRQYCAKKEQTHEPA